MRLKLWSCFQAAPFGADSHTGDFGLPEKLSFRDLRPRAIVARDTRSSRRTVNLPMLSECLSARGLDQIQKD